MKVFTIREGSLQTLEFTGMKMKALPDQIVCSGADSNRSDSKACRTEMLCTGIGDTTNRLR